MALQPKFLSKEDVEKLFSENSVKHSRYKKTGTFIYRKAVKGETVLTIVSGLLETLKTAGDDDYVVRNIMIGSSAETYIINEEKILTRYDTTEKELMIDSVVWKTAEAKGEIIAFEYSGEPINFTAPWGELMLCLDGDYIGNPVGGSPTDIYRIERKTFDSTYGLKT